MPGEVLEQAGAKSDDISLFIPHQANQRITEAVADRLNVDMSRVYSNIAVHGNTSSASIPIALDECVDVGSLRHVDALHNGLPAVADDLFGGGFRTCFVDVAVKSVFQAIPEQKLVPIDALLPIENRLPRHIAQWLRPCDGRLSERLP